jgi:predicted outer membrane repeat protein
MQIGTSLSLIAPALFGGKPVIIDGGWDGKSNTVGSRIFMINSLSTGLVDVSISNLVLQNGNSQADTLGGGAINNSENLTLNNVTIKHSISDNGGAIYSTQGSLNLVGATVISGNTAQNSGGGIYVNAGNLNIIGSESGGVYTFVKITDNMAAALGGGVYASNATVNMQLAEISMTPPARPGITTIVPVHGGGMYMVGSALNMKQSVIANNKSTYDGAGIYQINGSTYIEASTINSNTAGRYGGGIYAAVSNFEIVNSTISGNQSGQFGGGIYYSSNGTLSLTYTTIANNISGTAKNAVEISGGGIYQTAGTVQMIDSIVAQNYHYDQIAKAYVHDFQMASGSVSSIQPLTASLDSRTSTSAGEV